MQYDKTMNRTLVGMITDRADQTFGKKVTGDNYDEWEAHWIATGRIVYEEFVGAGLPKTAEAVKKHVDETEKYHNRNASPVTVQNTAV